MRRHALLLLLAVLGVQGVASTVDARGGVRSTAQRRTIVSLHQNWPLSRPARSVLVHAPRAEIGVSPATFLPPVACAGAAIPYASGPTRDLIAWEDGETLTRGEDWTQFTLKGDALGKHFLMEIPAGRVQLDWAEIVFGGGETQVVDFGEKTYAPGLYSMVDSIDGRQLDHIRVVARARTSEAKVTLRMLKQ